MNDQKTQPAPHPLDTHDVNMAVLNAHPADRKVLLHFHGEVKEADSRRQGILKLVQEGLLQLRLDMKYLIFDLEATRRERDQAIAELKEAGLR